MPTKAPTTRFPTRAPTTAEPTSPIDTCTRQFTAQFTLTYPEMTNGIVRGTLVYDGNKNYLAFKYENQSYNEIYQFNPSGGFYDTGGQAVYRISPSGACAPCAKYHNSFSFPILWNMSGVASPVPVGPPDATVVKITLFLQQITVGLNIMVLRQMEPFVTFQIKEDCLRLIKLFIVERSTIQMSPLL